MHFDLDYFFAQCEEREVPELEVRRAGVRVSSLSQTLKKQKQLTEFA